MIIHPSVYRLLDHSQNPALPAMLERSAYSLDEIKATLAAAEQVKAEYEALYNRAHVILDPIDHFERLDNENALAHLITENAYIQSGVRFDETFPLTQWRKAIAAQRSHNRKIEKALKGFAK